MLGMTPKKKPVFQVTESQCQEFDNSKKQKAAVLSQELLESYRNGGRSMSYVHIEQIIGYGANREGQWHYFHRVVGMANTQLKKHGVVIEKSRTDRCVYLREFKQKKKTAIKKKQPLTKESQISLVPREQPGFDFSKLNGETIKITVVDGMTLGITNDHRVFVLSK